MLNSTSPLPELVEKKLTEEMRPDDHRKKYLRDPSGKKKKMPQEITFSHTPSWFVPTYNPGRPPSEMCSGLYLSNA